MSRFKTVAPVMIYMDPKELSELKHFARENKLTVSSIARDGIRMRLAGDKEPYNEGFNEALDIAIKIAHKTEWAKITFPSGKSFSDLICDELSKFKRDKEEF